MTFDGERFVTRFNTVWNGAGRFETHGCDILTLRDGKITAKRSYRKATL